ncbi:hypothetical protein F4802DRAFT_27527 [Xylaria palmicola]|nr:hypothetical protein F4802DRAFT_27527 [Xylaria palmicola]
MLPPPPPPFGVYCVAGSASVPMVLAAYFDSLILVVLFVFFVSWLDGSWVLTRKSVFPFLSCFSFVYRYRDQDLYLVFLVLLSSRELGYRGNGDSDQVLVRSRYSRRVNRSPRSRRRGRFSDGSYMRWTVTYPVSSKHLAQGDECILVRFESQRYCTLVILPGARECVLAGAKIHDLVSRPAPGIRSYGAREGTKANGSNRL